MNGNRMKYSSTPTYGMQKRSPLGKKPLFQQKSVMGPDFARATQQSTAAPAASLFTMPVQQPDPAVQTANPVQPGVFYGSAPYQQPFAGGYPMGGTVPGAIPAANPWMPGSSGRCRSKPAAFSRWAIRCRLCRTAASALVRRVLYRRRRLPPPMCSPRPRRAQWVMPLKRL